MVQNLNAKSCELKCFTSKHECAGFFWGVGGLGGVWGVGVGVRGRGSYVKNKILISFLKTRVYIFIWFLKLFYQHGVQYSFDNRFSGERINVFRSIYKDIQMRFKPYVYFYGFRLVNKYKDIVAYLQSCIYFNEHKLENHRAV